MDKKNKKEESKRYYIVTPKLRIKLKNEKIVAVNVSHITGISLREH